MLWQQLLLALCSDCKGWAKPGAASGQHLQATVHTGHTQTKSLPWVVW